MSLVLIAEDEEALLEIFSQVLEELGHRTLRALNGEQALALARLERPDLVVSDHMMPRCSGLELLRAMRADMVLGTVPFLLVSASRPHGLVEADAFLAKPVDLGTLEATVQRLLDSRPLLPTPQLGLELAAAGVDPSGAALRAEVLHWMAHQLQAPLCAARLEAQALLNKQGTEAAHAEERGHTASLLLQLDRVDALVHAIVDAASLSEGKVALRLESGDLARLVKGVVQEWQQQQPEVGFTLTGAEERVELHFDAERMRHLLNQLLSNAVKFGGDARRVEVSLALLPGHAAVNVRDWGRGIQASELPHIFNRFHRAEGNEGGGHGLGLYIASTLARLHGGSLLARSRPGEGATFNLHLPLRRGG